MPEPRFKTNRRFVVVLLAVTLIALEGVSYIGQGMLVRRGVIYEPPGEDAIREFYRYPPDPRLGWPSPERFGTDERDRSGSRLIPSFPDPDLDACASAYGDSFTWGLEATADTAWANVLSRMLNCRVSNFGVGGYGTDQSSIERNRRPQRRRRPGSAPGRSKCVRRVFGMRRAFQPGRERGDCAAHCG